MKPLPDDVAATILSKLRQDGCITEHEAERLYDGPPDDVANYLSGLTAEGIAQYTPYSDGNAHCHAYMYLGGRDPIAWDHSGSLEDLRAYAAR